MLNLSHILTIKGLITDSIPGDKNTYGFRPNALIYGVKFKCCNYNIRGIMISNGCLPKLQLRSRRLRRCGRRAVSESPVSSPVKAPVNPVDTLVYENTMLPELESSAIECDNSMEIVYPKECEYSDAYEYSMGFLITVAFTTYVYVIFNMVTGPDL